MISIAACLYLMLQLPRLTWIRFGVWLVLGLGIYFFYGMRNSRLQRRAEARESRSAA
jgi:basic amino acid/polyamine antiporter, APA family